MNNRKGFTVVEGVIIVAVIAIIGALGWAFYNNQMSDSTTSKSETTTTALPTVESTDDLQKAEDAVNAIDIDKSIDTSDIDATLE